MNRNSVWIRNVAWIFSLGSVCILGFSVAGCGDSKPVGVREIGVGHGTVLYISIQGDKFNKSKLVTKSNEQLTISLSVPKTEKGKHALVIKGNGVDTQSFNIRPGDKGSLTIGSNQGTYTYSDAYGDAKGTLIVE